MFGHKAKSQPDQANNRRQVRRGGSGTSPAFSYYTSRVSEGPVERTLDRREQQPEVGKKKGYSFSAFLAGLPFWILLVVAIVCTGKILMVSSDPKVVVVGSTPTSSSYLKPMATYEAAAQKLLASSITNRSKLTIDANGVSRALKQEFPELQDVSMSIPLVNSRPVIYIQPADPGLVIQTTHGNYVLSKSGSVLASLNALPTGIQSVVDQSSLVPEPGKQVLPSSAVTFVQIVAYQFKAAQLPISAFVLPANSPYELDVRLVGKPYDVRFNLEEDALTQSGAAIATIQQLGSTVPADYIDVRVPGRVYYK